MSDRNAHPAQASSRRGGKRLYLLDARHGVERRLLLSWLRARGRADVPPLEPNWINLSSFSRGRSRNPGALSGPLGGDDATEVIPLRVAWRIPAFQLERGLRMRDLAFGDPRAPGRLRAWLILLRDRQRAECLQGAPATIGDLKQRFALQVAPSEHADAAAFAGFVARQAALTLDSEERGIRGSRYKVPRFVGDSILASPSLRPALGKIARERGSALEDLVAEARDYLKEMVSTPSAFFLDLRAQLDRRLWMRGYDHDIRHDPAEFERLRQTMRKHPTVLLFTHKTYGDAALPGLLLYLNDLPMLHTFGGINLDFLGFGTLMRRSGGIFIRRSFQDNPVYKLVLRKYVAYLLEKRFPMSWALEGTRSRLGKLMPPRYGLLRYTLDAAHDAGIEDLHIVPFVASFELIRDVEEYAAEQTGGAKKPESLKWLLDYARGVRRPMGSVRVDLGEPVVVKRAPSPDDRLAVAKIAFETAVQANRATPLTVTGVMCLVLLGMAPRGATAAELLTFVAVLADWARARGIRLSDALASGDRAAFLAKLDHLARSGLLTRNAEGSVVVYAIEPSRHPIASYYRNTIVHHFLNKAIIELALFQSEDAGGEAFESAFWAETERLRELFKFEFFYPPREQFRGELLAELERVDPHWHEHATGDGRQRARLTGRLQPFVGHAVLLPYVEAYTVVVELLARLGPGERLDETRCVDRALREGTQAYLLRRVSSAASIGRILFENGYRLAANLGLAGDSTPEAIEGRHALRKELQSLVGRMERLRLEALACAEEVMAMQAGR